MAEGDATGPFEQCVAGLDYPMVVVTVAAETEQSGCLVGFASQCSIDPARYAMFLSARNHTAGLAARSELMVVHLLRPDDTALARLFGETTGDNISKFDACAWHEGPGGVPVLEGCDWFAGRIIERHNVGDHRLHLLEVIDEGECTRPGAGQLGLQAVNDLDAGHEA